MKKWKKDSRIRHTGCIESAPQILGFFKYVQVECVNSLSSIGEHMNGDGFDGGAGGFGGSGGKLHIFGFGRKLGFSVNRINGNERNRFFSFF